MQDHVAVNVVHLGDRTNVAGNASRHFGMFLAVEVEQVADLERLAVVADEQLAVLGDRALMDAENAELADEGINQHLEHMRHRMLLRIGDRLEFLDRLAFAFQERFGVAFERVGQQFDEDVQQLLDPCAGAGRDEADRNQVAFAQRFPKGRAQLLRLDILALQVQRHQVLIHFDHLIHQGGVGAGHAGKVAVAGSGEEAVHDRGATVGRQVDRQAFLAETFLNLVQQGGQVNVFGVNLVDDDHPALPALGGALEHPLGHRFDAGLGVDDDRYGVHCRQYRNRLADEIGKARGVEQVDMSAAVVQIDQGRVQRVLVRLFLRVEIADRVAFFHDAGRGQLAGAMQNGLHQGGFSSRAMPDQGDIADGFGGITHQGLLSVGCSTVWFFDQTIPIQDRQVYRKGQGFSHAGSGIFCWRRGILEAALGQPAIQPAPASRRAG